MKDYLRQKWVIEILLRNRSSNEGKIQLLYEVENNITQNIDPFLKPKLSSKEKSLLHWVQAKIDFYDNELKKEVSNNDIEGKGESNRDKTKRVRNFSDDFIDELIKGKYLTNTDVLNALKEIEPRYSPAGKREMEPLKKDGTPYEKRICEALSIIFSLKNGGETIDWTTIRDFYRETGKPISKVRE